MVNDLKIGESHPIDENLRPVKVGGDMTSLELASFGDGARVNGDLSVNGNVYSDTVVAGQILGYTKIQNDGTGADDYEIEIDTTLTVLQTEQGTDVSVTFTAPPSGNVEITFTACLKGVAKSFEFALSDNASYNEIDESYTYDIGVHQMDELEINMVTVAWTVTGLTSGTSYTYYIAAAEQTSTLNQILHGRQRVFGVHFPPIIVKAIALPSNIVTGE